MPAAPPPPGVATHKAAAMAEGKDPDQAVQEARAKVTLIQSICLCQGRPASCRAFRYMVEKKPKTGQAGGLP